MAIMTKKSSVPAALMRWAAWFAMAMFTVLLGTCSLLAPSAFGAEEDADEEPLPEKITVQFRQGIGVVGALPEAALDMTINDAFAETKAERPASENPSEVFKGWAATEGAKKPMKGYLALSKAYEKAGSDGMLILYPVFGTAEKPHLSFYGPDGKTLLAETDIDSWQTIGEAKAAPRVLLKDPVTHEPALRKFGHCFIGWSDKQGEFCRSDQPLSESVALYPTYLKIEADLEGAKGASAELSQAYVLKSDLEHAVSVSFKIAQSSGPDVRVKSALSDDGTTAFASFYVTMGYLEGGEETLVRSDFGQVPVQLPTTLADGARVRVYWIKGDGSVGRTAVQKVESGHVSFELGDYGVGSAGNVVISSPLRADDSGDSGSEDHGGGSSPDSGDSGKGSADRPSAGPGDSAGVDAPTPVPDSVIESRKTSVPGVVPDVSGVTTKTGRSNGAAASDGGDDDDDDATGADGKGARKASKSKGVNNAVDGTINGDLYDEALAQESAAVAQPQSKEGGVLYGAIMAAMAAAAIFAWWLAFVRGKKTPVTVVGESSEANGETDDEATQRSDG